jgi:hypothetical protein
MDVIKEVISLKAKHYYCEDSWYSCPKAEDGCCNDSKGEECDCGADKQHEKIDLIVAELRRIGINEEKQASAQQAQP